jgi:hypothetical protein
MKYFAPDLIVAYGSDDPAVWQAAEARWEDACDRYNAHLHALKDQLPPGLLRVEDGYYLHDARVWTIGRRGQSLVVVLQPDAPPRPLLTFTYDLVEVPLIQEGVLPVEYRTAGEGVEWQYAEIERVPGEPPTWRQSILLSNGWEVTVHFRTVAVEEAQALLPAPRNGQGIAPSSALPQAT